MTCHGNPATHCCWLAGNPCPFLEVDTVPGRRWACGLRRSLGSWEKVHADSRYQTQVRPAWDDVEEATGRPFADCGDWPAGQRPQCCFAGEPEAAEPAPELRAWAAARRAQRRAE